MTICSVCGAKLENGMFELSNTAKWTKDKMYTRVCQYAKLPGCINTCTTVNPELPGPFELPTLDFTDYDFSIPEPPATTKE